MDSNTNTHQGMAVRAADSLNKEVTTLAAWAKSDEFPDQDQVLGLLTLLQQALDSADGPDLPLRTRIHALHHLTRPLLKIVSGLPVPQADGPNLATMVPPTTIAQRLFEHMCQSLDRLLIDIDQVGTGNVRAADAYRRWLVRHQFKFIGYQIDYAVIWGRPAPAGTWQRLHDLFGYLSERGDVEPHAAGQNRQPEGFEPGILYKRLLLLSLATQLVASRRLNAELLGRLYTWAAQSSLIDPDGHEGKLRVFVVDTATDSPPHYQPTLLDDRFSGYLLQPPEAFIDLIGLAESAREVG